MILKPSCLLLSAIIIPCLLLFSHRQINRNMTELISRKRNYYPRNNVLENGTNENESQLVVPLISTTYVDVKEDPHISMQRNTLRKQFGFEPPAELVDLYLSLGPQPGETLVSVQDHVLASEVKVFIYPIPKKFHADVAERYGGRFGCLTEACNESKMQAKPFQYEDYEAEIIILRKFLASLHIVSTPEEADFSLIPALFVTAINGRIPFCRAYGSCESSWVRELFSRVHSFHKNGGNKNKPIVILATQDSIMNHHSVVNLMAENQKTFNATPIVVNYGPGGLVVPSLNTERVLQPTSEFTVLPLQDRDIFAVAVFGVRHTSRLIAANQLDAYNGTNFIYRGESSAQALAQLNTNRGRYYASVGVMGRAIFNLCLPGDLPFVKRLFDTLLSVVIPVVFVFKHGEKKPHGGNSEFDSYWTGNNIFPLEIFERTGLPAPSIKESYPYLARVGVNIRDLVVELDASVILNHNSTTTIMAELEKINDQVIRQKLKNIERVRNSFLYDLSGTGIPDAFTDMLFQLIKQAKK